MCHPGISASVTFLLTDQHISQQIKTSVKKKVQRIQRYAKKMYSSIKRCNKNTSNHVFKNLSKEIFQKKHIKKHIKTSFFGFQPLSLGCGPLSLGRGPQDCKHKSGAVFSPKNQTPRLAGNVLLNVYLRFNIFSKIQSHIQYQKSLQYLRCSIMKKSTNWYTQCRVYLCVCACVPSSFHATSHQSRALPGLQHQSIEWLAQFLTSEESWLWSCHADNLW